MQASKSFYAPFGTLERLLGEPDGVQITGTPAGVNYRRAHFPCGCKANGVSDSAICFPCRAHEPLRAYIGLLAPI